MNIVVAPDSFKGSLSAKEVGIAIEKSLKAEIDNVNVNVIPMSDGGEGFIESLIYATEGQKVHLEATGPLGNPLSTAYGILGDKKTVVIEVAQIVGLLMVPDKKRNPMITTTLGIGEMIRHALDRGYRTFIFGLGGSATNDGGMGMLQALGGRFLDADDQLVQPVGSSLSAIQSVDLSKMDPRLQECTLMVASDVENPLCGTKGASHVFGPQKGATKEQIVELDEGLYHYAMLMEKEIHRKVHDLPGAGAAGGLGFALLTLGAQLLSGAKIVGEATQLEARIQSADLVITGEGQSDFQTLYGKVPLYVAKLARSHGVRTLLIAGNLEVNAEEFYSYFTSCHSIAPGPRTLEYCMSHAEMLLIESTRNIARLLTWSYSDSDVPNRMEEVT